MGGLAAWPDLAAALADSHMEPPGQLSWEQEQEAAAHADDELLGAMIDRLLGMDFSQAHSGAGADGGGA